MKIEFPCLNVRLVPIAKVQPNGYNPNKMEAKMFRLLKKSITEDGLTMPIVTYYDAVNDIYEIVDGFHRYSVLLKMKIQEIPVSVIEKPIEERMMSTIRHNKAKGTHQLKLVSNIFNKLLEKKEMADVADGIGAEAEEVVIYRKGGILKDEFKDLKHSNSWERNPDDKILYTKKKYDEYEEQ
jgi:ParB-like chromosome segregation protein Spo0J